MILVSIFYLNNNYSSAAAWFSPAGNLALILSDHNAQIVLVYSSVV